MNLGEAWGLGLERLRTTEKPTAVESGSMHGTRGIANKENKWRA